jgi:DNA-directed RNA polymerase specialized sigma24 family protein
VQDIARQLGLTENNTSKILSRTRDKLKAYLGEEDAE